MPTPERPSKFNFIDNATCNLCLMHTYSTPLGVQQINKRRENNDASPSVSRQDSPSTHPKYSSNLPRDRQPLYIAGSFQQIFTSKALTVTGRHANTAFSKHPPPPHAMREQNYKSESTPLDAFQEKITRQMTRAIQYFKHLDYKKRIYQRPPSSADDDATETYRHSMVR